MHDRPAGPGRCHRDDAPERLAAWPTLAGPLLVAWRRSCRACGAGAAGRRAPQPAGFRAAVAATFRARDTPSRTAAFPATTASTSWSAAGASALSCSASATAAPSASRCFATCTAPWSRGRQPRLCGDERRFTEPARRWARASASSRRWRQRLVGRLADRALGAQAAAPRRGARAGQRGVPRLSAWLPARPAVTPRPSPAATLPAPTPLSTAAGTPADPLPPRPAPCARAGNFANRAGAPSRASAGPFRWKRAPGAP